jgi:hypothetical protein
MRRSMADCIYMAYVVQGEQVDGVKPRPIAVNESSFPS